MAEVRNAIHEAVEARAITPITDESKINRLIGHLSKRHDMLSYLFERVGRDKQALVEFLLNQNVRSYVGSDELATYAMSINGEKRKLVFELLIDIDSLFFEVNSFCELMRKLMESIYEHVSKPLRNSGSQMAGIICGAGIDVSWFRDLASDRNFFTHEGTPYLAVDLSTSKDGRYELLFLRNDTTDFKNEKDFRRWSDIMKMVDGFNKSVKAIIRHIADVILNRQDFLT